MAARRYPARPRKLRATIEGVLDRYFGKNQVHLIGNELWGGYPAWRQENGAGRIKRNRVRKISEGMARAFADMEPSDAPRFNKPSELGF